MEGQLRFKIDWASLIVGMKFTSFACFSLYLRQFPSTSPPGGEGRLIHGGAYFRNITVFHSLIISKESKHMLINDKSLRLYGNFYR